MILISNLTMYGYWSTKISLCMVKDQPKGGGRSYIIWHIYIYIILYKMRETFFFKTVALGTKIAFSRLYLACATIFDRFEIICEMLWDKRISFDKISIHNKNSRKKVLRAWIPLQCLLYRLSYGAENFHGQSTRLLSKILYFENSIYRFLDLTEKSVRSLRLL